MKTTEMRTLIRGFAVEMIMYAILVTLYSVLVLRLLGKPLSQLFGDNLTAYAFMSLGLIVAQAVLLDSVTSFLLDQLHLERIE